MKIFKTAEFFDDSLYTKKYYFCGIRYLKKNWLGGQANHTYFFNFKISDHSAKNRFQTRIPYNFTQYTLIKKTDDILTFPTFENITVSIIIPVYNNWKYTKLCLQSILNNTNDVSYEIIIADDNSTDTTKNIKKYIKNIKVVKNTVNLRFLKNCNNAAKYTKGKYILFLNNDTQVQKGWLKALVEEMEKDPSIGLVGSKLIYPDGTLQEAGGIIYSDASGCNYGKNNNPDCICYNYKKEIDYISGASIMLSKSLWDKLGGFDELFAPAYYEDTDLAFRIRYNENLKVVYVPKSIVIHFEGKTNGVNLLNGQKKYQIINREKFYDKWKEQLHKYHVNAFAGNELARERAQTKKNILVIDWKVLSFSKDTGSRTTWQYIQFFLNQGFNVKFYPNNKAIEDDYLQLHLDEGIEVIYQNFIDYIKKYGMYFDYVYINRPNVAINYIELLRIYTRAKIIYQAHDLHYLRQYRDRLLAGKKQEADHRYPIEKKMEYDVFSKVDVACTFSHDEVNTMLSENKYLNALQIPLFIFDTKNMTHFNYVAKTRQDIMFVAGFRHTPNIDAAVWFVKEVFPLIKKNNKDIKLWLVGANPSQDIVNLQSKDIIVTGFVSDEELTKLYSCIRLVVVPLRSGAGVKGKIIESLYNKVPVVTTTIGIEGIHNDNNLISVEDRAQDFAKTVSDLYNNFDELERKSKQCKDYIDKYFSEKAVKNSLIDYIDFNNKKD
ncbi:MAG: glycosyltransferase [Proteobacteria bacterium]|nr:glycosyltransferase [Candidatus Enterousia onthequi]